MKKVGACVVVSLSVIGVACVTADGAAATARPNYEAYFDDAYSASATLDARRLADRAAERTAWVAGMTTARAGLRSHFDADLGVPTFLWASADNNAPAASTMRGRKVLTEARARDFLKRESARLGVSAVTVDGAELVEVHDSGRGPRIARFRQRLNGIEVFGRRLNVTMDRDDTLVSISGYFAPDTDITAARLGRFRRPAVQAVADAFADLGGRIDAAVLAAGQTRGEYSRYALPSQSGDYRLAREPRVKKVYYPLRTRLVPAYYVEVFAASRDGRRDDARGYVISAQSGRVLMRNDLRAYDQYSYRVFADATGNFQPFDGPLGNGYTPFAQTAYATRPARTTATANLVALDHAPPISTGDPWLATGATVTTGNNVDAYLDLDAPDGFTANSSDLRAMVTSANTFDYAITADQNPTLSDARNAAIVNLFYLNNWLHDFWYDHGLDEVAGNAQQDNYSRGGVGGDPILAEGQDYSGSSNANMTTPADGDSPRMQMFLWQVEQVRVTSPALGNVDYGVATFGPATFDISGDVVIVDDGTIPTGDGCETIQNAARLAGNIALIDRGNCNFIQKVTNAQAAGAIAVVVVDNRDENPIAMGLTAGTADTVTIPSVLIRIGDGQSIKDTIAAAQAATVYLLSDPSVFEDGTLDNQVASHEFFHYVSNRLINDGSGLITNQARGLGEGWSDFDTLLLTVRPEDTAVTGNDRYQGAYPVGFYADAPQPSYFLPTYYFGIRRAPYSTDFAVNPLTFKYVENGVALPTSAPLAFDKDGLTNAEVHGTGEIWANTLWEVYASLLNDSRYSFDEARGRMQDYLIEGLKTTPVNPTFTEARDAILAAAKATDCVDYQEMGAAFARRGLGVDAVSPNRVGQNNTGVKEDFTAPNVTCAPPPSAGGGSSGGSAGNSGGGSGGGGACGEGVLALLAVAAAMRRARDWKRRGGI